MTYRCAALSAVTPPSLAASPDVTLEAAGAAEADGAALGSGAPALLDSELLAAGEEAAVCGGLCCAGGSCSTALQPEIAANMAKCRRICAPSAERRRGRVCAGFKVACANFPMSAAEVYRKTRKVPDLFWNAYVCRPIAAVFVSAVERTRLTPNQITISAVFVALVSVALLLALPGHLGLILGALVFELSYVLDCADGMLARWRGTASPVGHLLDFLMDELKAFLLLAAVAVRLFREHGDTRFLLLGLFGLVVLASGIALTTFVRRPEVMGPAGTPAGPATERSVVRRAIGFVESGAKFLIHYPSYLLIVALIGRIELYFVPYVAVNALYAARAFAGVAWRFGRSQPG